MASKKLTATVSSETMTQPLGESAESLVQRPLERRSFLKGLGITGATLSASALFSGEMLGEESSITKGDAALLRFAAAAEILETDRKSTRLNSSHRH